MPVVKTILKKVRQQAGVKLVGDGTATVTSLDLKLADETVDQPNVKVTVTGAMWTTPGPAPIVVTRNGNVTQYFNGNDNWSMTQTLGFPATEEMNANISIAMPANSMIYLHLTKLDGFDEPNQQILPR